jgi:hypothetical protein
MAYAYENLDDNHDDDGVDGDGDADADAEDEDEEEQEGEEGRGGGGGRYARTGKKGRKNARVYVYTCVHVDARARASMPVYT